MVNPIYMKSRSLTELVSASELSMILHDLTAATGLSIALVAPDGNFMVRPTKPTRICTHFIQRTVGSDKCVDCDKGHIWDIAIKGAQKYKCWTGLLTDMVAPITVKGHAVAALFGGQVVEGDLDLDSFAAFADKIGISDKRSFLREAGKLRTMRPKELDSSLRVISSWAEYICRFAQQRDEAEFHLAQKAEQLEKLYTALERINDPALVLGQTLEVIRDESMHVIEAKAACCCQVDVVKGDLRQKITCGMEERADCCALAQDKGIINEAISLRKTRYLPNARGDLRYTPAFSWVKSVVVAPIVREGRVLAVLNMESDRLNAFDNDLKMLDTLAGQAAVAMENAVLREETNDRLRKRVRELSTFFRVAEASSRKPLDETLDMIVDEALSLLNADWGSIRQYSEAKGKLLFRTIRPLAMLLVQDIAHMEFDLEESAGGRVFRQQTPHYCNDVASDPLDKCRPFSRANAHVIVPITFGEHRIGVLTVDTERRSAFTGESTQLLAGLADIAAAAIHSNEVQERLSASERRVRTVLAVAQHVASAFKLEDALPGICEGTCDALNAEACSVFLKDRRGRFVLRATTSRRLRHLIGRAAYAPGEGRTGSVASRQEPLLVEVARDRKSPKGKFRELPTGQVRSWMAAPILKDGRVRGVVRVVNKIPSTLSSMNEFTEDDKSLLGMVGSYLGSWDREG